MPSRTADRITGGSKILRGVSENADDQPKGQEMKLFNMLKNFRNDESGAVTVDWVVLTAAIVGLGVAVLASVRTGTTTLAASISSELATMTVDNGQ
jgi:Flp pilus assembly pilin Flp